jgi:hypothetical protein
MAHDGCIDCGTTERPHRAHGRCKRCDDRWRYASNSDAFCKVGTFVGQLTVAKATSANITGAGLAGRNLEMGVLVRGPQVVVISGALDLFV